MKKISDDSRFIEQARTISLAILLVFAVISQLLLSLYAQFSVTNKVGYFEIYIKAIEKSNEIRKNYPDQSVYIDYLDQDLKLNLLPVERCVASFHYGVTYCQFGNNFVAHDAMTLVTTHKCVSELPQFLIDVSGNILVPDRNINRSQLKSVPRSGVKIRCRIIARNDVFPTDVEDWILFRRSEVENGIRVESSTRFDKSYRKTETNLAIEDLSRQHKVKTEIFGISIEGESISIFFPGLIFVLSVSFLNKLRRIKIVEIDREEPWVVISPDSVLEKVLVNLIRLTIVTVPSLSFAACMILADGNIIVVLFGAICNICSLLANLRSSAIIGRLASTS